MQDSYQGIIELLSQSQFEEFVSIFLKSKNKTNDVHFCDGPYDGGKDVLINVPGKSQKRKGIQITVQEARIEDKIAKEVVKTKGHNRSDLVFFWKYSLTSTKQENLKDDAEQNHDVKLDLYDSRRLAALVEAYTPMREYLSKTLDKLYPTGAVSVLDDKTITLFDTLSMNSNITEIKNNFVVSYIEHQLFVDGPLSVSEIFAKVNPQFRDKFPKTFYEKLVGELKRDGQLYDIPLYSPKKFDLTTEIRHKLENIVESTKLSEKELLVTCDTICKGHNIELPPQELMSYIVKLFDENYAIDVSEITKGVGRKSNIKSIYSSLIAYITKKATLQEEGAMSLAKELIEGCSKNNIINKSSISKMFVGLFEDDKLDDYLQTTERIVYLDTQILLQLLCVNHEDGKDYPDYLYRHTAELISCCKNSSIPVNLTTTSGYVDEVVHHVIDAVHLDRFLSLSYIQDLGQSKNVFCNFYNYLISNGYDYQSLSDFMMDLLSIEDVGSEKAIRDAVYDLLKYSDPMVMIEPNRRFDPDVWTKYRIEYEKFLDFNHYDKKTFKARNNDLSLVLSLSMYTNSGGMAPYFITWDTSFYRLRDTFSKFDELEGWYLYSPQKFANTISVINMKIDPQTVNYNIISLVEENFNASSDTISFLDQLNVFFEGKDLSQNKLARKFGELRRELLNADQTDRAPKPYLPIDEFILLLSESFSDKQAVNDFSDLKSLFNDNDYADAVFNILKTNMESYKTSDHKLKTQVIEDFDKLINKQKINKSDKID